MRSYDLTLDGRDPLWPELVNLLQAGFWIEAWGERSVRDFMREALGFEDEYIERSISTVFVDSQPVDDLDAALVGPGSRLALSAAMPGLVGAVMRIKSPYASFRSAISYGAAGGEGAAAGGTAAAGPAGGAGIGAAAGGLVSVKLFNSVMAERGPALLGRGLLVDASELAPLAARLGSGLAAAPASPGRPGGDYPESRAEPSADLAFLRVRAEARPMQAAISGGEARR